MASLDLWRLHSHCYFVLKEPLVVNGTTLEPTVDKCLANEASVIIQYLEEDQNNDLTVLSMFIRLSSCGVNQDNISSPQKWRLESIQSFPPSKRNDDREDGTPPLPPPFRPEFK